MNLMTRSPLKTAASIAATAVLSLTVVGMTSTAAQAGTIYRVVGKGFPTQSACIDVTSSEARGTGADYRCYREGSGWTGVLVWYT